MLGLDPRAARATWTAVLVLALLGLAFLARKTLFIFTLALFFSYMLRPVMLFIDSHLAGRRLPRNAVLALTYVFFIAVLVGIGFVIGSVVSEQASALSSNLPALLKQDPLQSIGLPVWLEPWRARIVAALRQQVAGMNDAAFPMIQKLLRGLLTHLELPLFIVLVPILAFFLLKDGARIKQNLLIWVAEDASLRGKIDEILNDVHILLGSYIRALVLLSLATFSVYAMFLSILGMPYPALLALVAALFEFIPVVGPLAAAITIVLVAAFAGFGHILMIVVFLLVYRMLQDYVLSPYLMGTGVELHPLLVLFGVLAGEQIAGIPGMFLSVPVIAILRVVYLRMQRGSRQRELAPEVR